MHACHALCLSARTALDLHGPQGAMSGLQKGGSVHDSLVQGVHSRPVLVQRRTERFRPFLAAARKIPDEKGFLKW